VDAWDWAQTLRPAAGAGTNASGRTHGNGRKRVRPGTDSRRGRVEPGTDSWNWAQIPRAHGAAGANTGSGHEWKANRAQPLRSRHVSGYGRVRHRTRA
jgi:hypothetical protein